MPHARGEVSACFCYSCYIYSHPQICVPNRIELKNAFKWTASILFAAYDPCEQYNIKTECLQCEINQWFLTVHQFMIIQNVRTELKWFPDFFAERLNELHEILSLSRAKVCSCDFCYCCWMNEIFINHWSAYFLNNHFSK
jgi:hypothetical protein